MEFEQAILLVHSSAFWLVLSQDSWMELSSEVSLEGLWECASVILLVCLSGLCWGSQ
jgi:hypothetical protein